MTGSKQTKKTDVINLGTFQGFHASGHTEIEFNPVLPPDLQPDITLQWTHGLIAVVRKEPAIFLLLANDPETLPIFY